MDSVISCLAFLFLRFSFKHYLCSEYLASSLLYCIYFLWFPSWLFLKVIRSSTFLIVLSITHLFPA